MNHFFLQLKEIFFTVPQPYLPTRYLEMYREIKKSPVKLRQSIYFICIYVWNIQQKITVSEIVSYSSVDDPLGLKLSFKGEEDGDGFQLETKKQVQVTIESLYRPNTWVQITTSIPFQLALGGGIFFLYLQTASTQNSRTINFLSQFNFKNFSSLLVSNNKHYKQLTGTVHLNVYGQDWLLIEKTKDVLPNNDQPSFSVSTEKEKNSIYLRKIKNLLNTSPTKKHRTLKKEEGQQSMLYLPLDLGFANNKTQYFYRKFNLCTLNSISKKDLKIDGVPKSLEFKARSHHEPTLSHKTAFFYNQGYDNPFLFFQTIDRLLIYGIFPYLATRIWLAPAFVLWWAYKFDSEKKKQIKKNIKKIQKTENIKINKFLEKTVTFRDIGGMQTLKKELRTVAFLLRNKNYSSPYPTGYIFAGPPGTGKTLMAKAMAYEAQTPYLYVEGYQFQDQERDIANARVDDLFNQIRDLSPCILYIDEIDSIGERRDINISSLEKIQHSYKGSSPNTNSKPSDTVLMQFLLYMDGFQTKRDGIIIGATNRLEILDDALLRPGRFDRQILFSPPLFKERIDILKIFFAKGVLPLDDRNLEELAQRSMGFNGCDLRLLADNFLFLSTYGIEGSNNQSLSIGNPIELKKQETLKKIIDLDGAFERISRVCYKITDSDIKLKKKDFYRTACHEIGKAIIQTLLPESFPIYSIQLFPKPLNDRFLEIERQNIRVPSIDLISTNNADCLLQKIVVLLAGRAAECALFDENLDNISTYLNRSFDPNLYVACQTSRYLIELGLFDSKSGILENSFESFTIEQNKDLLFSQTQRFVKDKALNKVTRQLRKTIKFEFQKPFLQEFWYEQDYVWDFDFIQQNKTKENEESLKLDLYTIANLHTLFQYTYDFFKSNIKLVDYLTFLLLKEKQLSYSKIVKILNDFNLSIPEKSWKSW